jgi:cation transport regulator ChaC
MLHFAYGSNMSRRVMRRHAPHAEPLGAARLPGYRFVITANGYASVAPLRAGTVHGVLWRLTPRDRVTLDAWESVAAGEYGVEILPVVQAGRRRRALVYVARRRRVGAAKPGYMEVVIAAAREWELSEAYIASLLRFLPKRPFGAGQRKFGEFGWT